MKKLKAGWIGYIDHKTPDFWENCNTLKVLGYQGMELGEFLMDLPGGIDNILRLRSLGIQPLSVLPEMPQLREEGIEPFIKKAHLLEVDNIAVHSCCITNSFEGKLNTYDEFMSDVELIEACAQKAAKEGLVLRYHNHMQEFTTIYSGLTAFEHMMRNSENIKLELDIGWAHYAGVDPVQIMKIWQNRLHAIHVKDYRHEPMRLAYGCFMMPAFTTVGTGVVNIEKCLRTACDIGIDWAIVEQDSMNRLDPMHSLIAAYCNMKETGYIE